MEIYNIEELGYRELSHEELIDQYTKESLAPILKVRKEIKIEKERLLELLGEKKGQKRKLLSRKKKTEIIEQIQELEAKDKPYQGMQSDLEYVICWLKNGHKPGPNRGIDRRSVYQNTKFVDPILMQKYYRSTESIFSWDIEEKEYVISPYEKMILNKAMAALTEKELEAFLMHKGKSLSIGQVAKLLGISRSSVQSRIEKANRKVAKILQEEKELD